jgi:peptidyl-Asp metalloendopeptidase
VSRRPAPQPFSLPFCLALLLAAGLCSGRATAAPPDLLQLLAGPAVGAPAEAVEVRPIEIDPAALDGELRLPLLDGEVYTGVPTSVERRGPRELTWRGAIQRAGATVGMATLTASGELMTGLITLPEAVYQILPTAGGGHLLAEIDTARLPPCAGPVASPQLRKTRPSTPEAEEAALAALSATDAAQGDLQTSIDLLVLYTPQARIGAGGLQQIRLAIQNSVDAANTALARSRIDAHLNLLDAREIKLAESGQAAEELGTLRSSRAVADLRSAVGADVVSLFVERMDDACGIGYVMNGRALSRGFAAYAFNVVRRICAPNFVLAHEVGHNLGCEHDPANGEAPDDASFPWSYGHFVDGSFRTIMSYSTECAGGCPRVAQFSNPEISWNGTPTGIAGQRDNHRTINSTRAVAARFASAQPCKPGPETLCLLGRRFRVEAEWENQFDGSQGRARAVPRSEAAGFFTFGDAKNLELMVKMLDFGSEVKLFYGQLTNLRFTLRVTDTATGIVKVYGNGPNDCGAIDQDGFKSAGSPFPAARATGGSCRGARDVLCLGNGRFQVKVDWRNPGDGSGGKAGAVALSAVTGAFYFTEPGNLELLAKVVDYGDRIDFFYGSLSNLEYTVIVTDTRTGAVKTYRNAAGTFCGGFDAHAF